MAFKFNDPPPTPATDAMRRAVTQSLINSRQNTPLDIGGDFVNNLCKDQAKTIAYLRSHQYTEDPKNPGEWIKANLV